MQRDETENGNGVVLINRIEAMCALNVAVCSGSGTTTMTSSTEIVLKDFSGAETNDRNCMRNALRLRVARKHDHGFVLRINKRFA